jgi:hypothetical protein
MKIVLAFTSLFLGLIAQVFPQLIFNVSEKHARVNVQKYAVLNEYSPDTRWKMLAGDEAGIIPSNRKFTAPVNNEDPMFTCVEVSMNHNVIVDMPGGVRIRIEKNDLVDQDGNAVNGNYTLYFRDLTTPAALALSGVTMKYESAGISGNFQTAGMFELYAVMDGKALNIRAGERIDIDIPTPNAEQGFNLYTFDEDKAEWQYVQALQNNLSKMPQKDSMTVYSNAWRYWRSLKVNDTLSFDERWADKQYARTVFLGRYDKSFVDKELYLLLKIPYFRIKKIPLKGSRTTTLFQLPILSKNADTHLFSKTFPEMSPVKNVVWQYIGSLDPGSFSKLYVQKKKYTDMRIEYDSPTGYFNILLKSKSGIAEFNAVPYRGNMSESNKAKSQNIQLMNKYSKSLRKTRETFDRKNKEYFLEILAKHRNRIMAEMAPEELAMSWQEWTDYAAKVAAYMVRRSNANQTIQLTRSFSITGFGLVNCDKIDRMEEPVKVLAKFVTPDGKAITNGKVMVVDGGDNSCLTLGLNDGLCTAVVEKKSPTIFAVADDKENLYIVKASDVFSFVSSSSGQGIFTLQKVETDASEAIHNALKM